MAYGRAKFTAFDILSGANANLEDMNFEAINDLPGEAVQGLEILKGDFMSNNERGWGRLASGCEDVSFTRCHYHGRGGPQIGGIGKGQLCEAWRPVLQHGGGVQQALSRCVAHDIHPEDFTVTVQFVSDQHRLRVQANCIRPIRHVEPKYPRVFLNKGERPPSTQDIEQNERERLRLEQLGIAPPPPDESDHVGEKSVMAEMWGLPGPTLDALRNRAIPPYQVRDEYGRHFYTSLYNRQNHEQHAQEQRTRQPANAGRAPEGWTADCCDQQPKAPTRVRYIKLDGTELEKQSDGSWTSSAKFAHGGMFD